MYSSLLKEENRLSMLMHTAKRSDQTLEDHKFLCFKKKNALDFQTKIPNSNVSQIFFGTTIENSTKFQSE